MRRSLGSEAVGRVPLHGQPDYAASLELLRRDTVRRVRDEMQGQPASVVHQVLVERLRGRLPGIEVDDSQMRRAAWAIEHGSGPSGSAPRSGMDGRAEELRRA
jgi:hypothetical protein